MVVPEFILAVNEDEIKLALLSKSLSGIIHKISIDPDVYKRWIRLDMEVTIADLERLLKFSRC